MAPLTADQLTVAEEVVTDEELNPAGVPQEAPAVIVKLVLEISKKMLPTASTLIRAVVVGVFGITTSALPSLAVLDNKTVGKLCPPSVDNDIFTLAQLTGEAVVLATAQVTVCVEPPVQETAVFGTETANGPEVLVTVTTTSSNCVCPTDTGDDVL